MTLTKQIDFTRNALNVWRHNETADVKKLFHSRAKKLLKTYATEILKLTPDQFDIRSCEGGPAVLGEVILHTDSIYIMIHDNFMGDDNQSVLFRKCEGRKDFCGKANNYTSLKALEKNDLLIAVNHKFFVMA